MIKPNIKIIILILAILILVFMVLLASKTQQKSEIQKIHALVQKAQETGEKEPLIIVSENGFSQNEIKIKANSFISFYDKTTGITSSRKFDQNTELEINNYILKIYVE